MTDHANETPSRHPSVTMTCPICGTTHHGAVDLAQTPYCSERCWYHIDADPTRPRTSSRHDTVTITCPICQRPFPATGRRVYCSDACKAAAYRRRRHNHHSPVTIAAARPRRPSTIYQCDNCGGRALGDQRCDECRTFMRRIGIGGCCPACDEPIAVDELLDQGR